MGLLALALSWAPPAVAVSQRSRNVAIVLGEGSEDAGTLPTTGAVAGDEEDSFESFSFTDVSQDEIEGSVLASYDTVVLNEVFTSSLTEAQKQTLSNFVTGGGKLIIHDADGTEGNSYSWLPVPAQSGVSCENCGNTDGQAQVVENNSIVSDEPSSPYYINVDELPGASDAVGDANVLVSTDPRWDVDIRASNDQNVSGAVDAYAQDGGLILYDGFDTDDIESSFGGVGWLQKIWYDELAQQWNPDNLPHSTPLVGESGHCGYGTVTVGVVVVCAEHISGSSGEMTATGDVVLDGALSVGEGPVSIDQETEQISMPAPAPISLLRSGGAISLGDASLSIEATPSTDPVSGTGNLAKISLSGVSLAGLGSMRVGGLPFSLPAGASISAYLDGEMGGGLVVAGSLQLPALGKSHVSGAVSLGFLAKAPHPVIALGGSVGFGSFQMAPGWKLDGISLSYQQPSDTWAVSGGLEAPIGSLQASGSVTHGQLESLQVRIGGQAVPLGDTGFFFSEFGGGFTGLAKGPLAIDASTAGYWGVPKAPVEPFYLDNVTLTVNLGGSVSLDGAVSLVLRTHSPLHGKLHLQMGLHPFSATGSFSVDGSLAGASLKAGGGAGFTTQHFTAVENGSIEAYGLSGKGEVIASDKGLGASGSLCAPFKVVCQSLAFAGTWEQIGKFDLPAIVGGQPSKLITVSGVSAAGESASVRVPASRRLLLIAVSNPAGAPSVTLYAPGGRAYRPGRRSRKVAFAEQPRFGLTTIAVVDPQAGRWRIVATEGGQTHIAAQTVDSLPPIHAYGLAPVSSARHPLPRKGHLLVRWASIHLPGTVRISVVVRSKARGAGVVVAHGLRSSGSYSIPVGRLPVGRGTIALEATLDGVPFQQVKVPGLAWRAAPPRHGGRKRRKRRRG